jgi:hypothetical protein
MTVGGQVGRVVVALGLLGVTAAAASAQTASPPAAPALAARDDASTGPAGRFGFGVWNPARWAVSDRIELAAHPLVFFVAPHLQVQVRHLRVGGWQLSGQYALSLPSPALRLLQGVLLPSWDRGGGQVGWTLVPRVGLLASRDAGAAVLTVRGDLALGLPLARTDARPLETLAPLDLLFDPVLAGYRGRVGIGYDRALGRSWRWRLLGDVYLHGIDRDHTDGFLSRVTFRVGTGVDLALGRRTRLVLGVYAWNDYQHQVDDDGNPVRSNLLLPVIDLLWSLGP